jgi:hypothetical protein
MIIRMTRSVCWIDFFFTDSTDRSIIACSVQAMNIVEMGVHLVEGRKVGHAFWAIDV